MWCINSGGTRLHRLWSRTARKGRVCLPQWVWRLSPNCRCCCFWWTWPFSGSDPLWHGWCRPFGNGTCWLYCYARSLCSTTLLHLNSPCRLHGLCLRSWSDSLLKLRYLGGTFPPPPMSTQAFLFWTWIIWDQWFPGLAPSSRTCKNRPTST